MMEILPLEEWLSSSTLEEWLSPSALGVAVLVHGQGEHLTHLRLSAE
jgi:hypothetical protein